ncbi:MAG: hypothetical protein HY294_06480 [Candidatus Rokubacteria bacterium]|nr:hypothetical protein [Candidatus Rokubacteria bacterium]
MRFRFDARRFRASLVAALVPLALVWAGVAHGAELQLRESLLEAQRDRVTIAITATVSHIGDEAHPLDPSKPMSGDDCDLHVPLRSQDIRLPLLGEVKNACSMKPAGESRAYWSREVYDETYGKAVAVTGVFRIWLEHPPAGAKVQSETQKVPSYTNSNPDHQVELHPLLRVGLLDFTDHVRRIHDGNKLGRGYGATELKKLLWRKKQGVDERTTIAVRRTTIKAEPYLSIVGAKMGFNHWNLRARVVDGPKPLEDGTRIWLDILKGNAVVPGSLHVPAVSVKDAQADGRVKQLVAGDIVEFQALVRLFVPAILDQAGSVEKDIDLPIEFVFLDVQ